MDMLSHEGIFLLQDAFFFFYFDSEVADCDD